MLVRCVYASRAKAPVAPDLFEAILEKSRKNNVAHGITGLLCFAKDTFVQVLEGGRDEVCELFNTIVRDGRHDCVRLLVFEEIQQRQFASWTMGHINLDMVNPALLLRYSEKAELNPFKVPGRATLALLEELAKSGAIISR
jgi:Sensors of blue-light using FAD